MKSIKVRMPSFLLNLYLPLLLVQTILLYAVQGIQTTTSSRSYHLYHSFGTSPNGQNEFSSRGSIVLSTGEGNLNVEASVIHDEGNLLEVRDQLDHLVSFGGTYKLKVVDEESGKSVLASVPVCDLRRSNLREQIELIIGQTGSLLSVSYSPLVSPLAPSCKSLPPLSDSANELKFQTTITYSIGNPGMTIPVVLNPINPPPGLEWIKSTAFGKSDTGPSKAGASFGNPGEQAKSNENQSFFRKYWYIILPIIIMNFIGFEQPQDSEQRQNDANTAVKGQRQKVTAAGTDTRAAATGGTGARQRRGKRS
eukprot:CAMPEP_0184865488 /NCGR_PEP_ID=MMETSP0580-20130426/18311_1 /TAXON_ID=1118495 /ORGANISM="Dactyliosolen fragilissimus" /LENGTH=308 /DNA_ID=CAMNT_0027364719 /DNA_START=9 /DNA_END=935 /DNA_ORIENTATION=+